MNGSPPRLSVLPTGRGWQVLFFGGLSLLLAALIGTTQIYQLAYALLALLLVSLALGYWSSRGLGYGRRIPSGERSVAGQESSVELLVPNTSRQRSPRAEIIDNLPEPRRFAVPPVEGGATRKVQATVGLPRRGLYELGPAEVRTADPFGFLRFARKFAERTEVVVYPRHFDLGHFPLGGRGVEPEARGSFARQGDEFSTLREYRHGDERRHIHWKSVARTGELIVREFSANSPRRYAVVLDLHRAGLRVPEAEVEDAVSAAASVLAYLAGGNLPFRLLCADAARNASDFGSGEAHFWGTMRHLATVKADGDAGPAAFLDATRRDELGEGLVLVSRALGDDLLESVARLRAAGLSVIVVAVAAHTYRGAGGGRSAAREAAFSGDVRRLELAGAAVRVVRRDGGVAALAGGHGGAAGAKGAV